MLIYTCNYDMFKLKVNKLFKNTNQSNVIELGVENR